MSVLGGVSGAVEPYTLLGWKSLGLDELGEEGVRCAQRMTSVVASSNAGRAAVKVIRITLGKEISTRTAPPDDWL